MNIVCIGGGPAGLYFGLLMKARHPEHSVRVVERNRPYDTFGWGVVFSDATMENMQRCDAGTAAAIEASFAHWDDIELRFKGRRIRSGGHGFVGIGRKKLLNILQARCEELGVELCFDSEVESDLEFADADLIIASDGINSRIRNRYAATFQPELITRPNRYIWLGVKKRFEAFTFDFRRTPHGWFQAHVYQFDDETSTFIVECPESVWLAHGLDRAGPEESIRFCAGLFAETLEGAELLSNARHLRGSAWLNFQRVVCGQWWLRNEQGAHVVLMGDAVHTAHFAIGSGTKLAIEDAIELANQFEQAGHGAEQIPAVLARYQELRRVETLKIQNAAWNAMEWFEVCGERYCDQLEPEQFMYSMLTRSQRISHENLRLRDKAWLEGYERWLAARTPLQADKPVPPMFTPYTVRGVSLKNRVIVSPMAQYMAEDGLVGDYHLVHLGARALGGAALVMAEMTCVSPDARITPGCPGLWTDAQGEAWARIVAWVHTQSDAKIGMQLGHAGPKGSTRRPWDGEDLPLPADGPEPNWPLLAASGQQYLEGVSAFAQAMTRADMDRVTADFVAATRRAAAAGFDWLELHCAHGYLLSSFISPLTNWRTDDYGGTLANRLRYPLEVFAALRAVWPEQLPISVRISAHDWVEGGITPADAVQIAKAFKAAGADLIDCSSGQVSKKQKPTYGRMFQTPFADRIRQEAGIPTIAVGAISEADHVNTIIAAGRADLCAVARPHLANPAWTLTEAARIGFKDLAWPKPYRSAKPQLEAGFARAAAGGGKP
ncbi:bifunctional salicylyl-CoA 5-hydroxylase/oxidoreductase [Inhella proteolytica]|uniref:Bifunctional salicylyl-CoA 5-hydroxylase/oxidoreductase n=1 Tax=Inhella proteolytica TaxID=2795029 RepID=A0A931J7V4_9BURK|nr:bifunctional salicylyl-CoA 5-hydroxylase/oxidoreductase [Inhella proteolytica]MBH9579149.1 bifunctional salicylyl-CoA 5-hydroxylase/oxidoreductase [Inhella proteolytica]